MRSIGIRELHTRTAEVLRKVRERKAEYVVTHRGRPVAVLLPVDTERLEQGMVDTGKQAARAAWERYSGIATEIRKTWPAGRRSDSVLDDVRR